MATVLVVAVAHSIVVEVGLSVSRVDRIRDGHAGFHACHQAGELEGGSRFHRRSDGVVEVFPVLDGAAFDFVARQVGDGADVPGGDFGHNHRAPGCFVST